MVESIDRLLLLIGCAILFCIHYTNYHTIALFLTALILCSLNYYFDNKWVDFFLFFLYLFLCFFWKDLIYFLPIMLYDPVRYPYRTITFLSAIPIVRFYSSSYISTLFILAVFCCFSIYLSLRTQQSNKLEKEVNHVRDTSYELSLIQEEKNRHALENKDYEINLAMLNERNRISKELHDNIGHLLSRSLLQIGALLTITKDDTTKEVLTDLRDSISDGMDHIRVSIHNMHDESIDLYSSLYTLVNEFSFCKIHFEYDINVQPSLKLKYCFISTVKESLNNIIKHSSASEVTVVLREHPGLYQLIISDNGKLSSSSRYKINQIVNQSGECESMGLQNIIDRVKGFQGTCRFNLEHGFQTHITIPKSSSSHESQ